MTFTVSLSELHPWVGQCAFAFYSLGWQMFVGLFIMAAFRLSLQECFHESGNMRLRFTLRVGNVCWPTYHQVHFLAILNFFKCVTVAASNSEPAQICVVLVELTGVSWPMYINTWTVK